MLTSEWIFCANLSTRTLARGVIHTHAPTQFEDWPIDSTGNTALNKSKTPSKQAVVYFQYFSRSFDVNVNP